MALGMARSEAQRQVVQRAKEAAGIRPGSASAAAAQRSRALDSAFEAARSKRGRKSISKKVLGPRSKLHVHAMWR